MLQLFENKPLNLRCSYIRYALLAKTRQQVFVEQEGVDFPRGKLQCWKHERSKLVFHEPPEGNIGPRYRPASIHRAKSVFQ
jgi:hypothetical protein